MVGHMMTFARRTALGTLCAAALVLSACQSKPAAPAAPPADAWATVNGHTITKDDVERAYRQSADPATPVSDEDALGTKLGVLDDLILERILGDRAAQQNLQVADSDVDKALADEKQKAGAAFQQQLTARTLTEADVRAALRRQMLAQKVIDHDVTSKIVVSDADVEKAFNDNRAQFNLQEDAYHLAQIVVTPVRDPQVVNRTGDDAATPEAARTKIAMLMQRLGQGTAFGDLARDYSEDPESTPRGGDLGLVPASVVRQAPPALRDAVLQTAPGRAKVVNTPGAVTIVYVVSHEQAGQRDLSTPGVRDQIRQALKARREQLLRTAYLAEARDTAQVTNYLARQVVQSQGKPATK
jgi:peptidyl-prolyl cis-trans isomerase SurA